MPAYLLLAALLALAAPLGATSSLAAGDVKAAAAGEAKDNIILVGRDRDDVYDDDDRFEHRGDIDDDAIGDDDDRYGDRSDDDDDTADYDDDDREVDRGYHRT